MGAVAIDNSNKGEEGNHSRPTGNLCYMKTENLVYIERIRRLLEILDHFRGRKGHISKDNPELSETIERHLKKDHKEDIPHFFQDAEHLGLKGDVVSMPLVILNFKPHTQTPETPEKESSKLMMPQLLPGIKSPWKTGDDYSGLDDKESDSLFDDGTSTETGILPDLQSKPEPKITGQQVTTKKQVPDSIFGDIGLDSETSLEDVILYYHKDDMEPATTTQFGFVPQLNDNDINVPKRSTPRRPPTRSIPSIKHVFQFAKPESIAKMLESGRIAEKEADTSLEATAKDTPEKFYEVIDIIAENDIKSPLLKRLFELGVNALRASDLVYRNDVQSKFMKQYLEIVYPDGADRKVARKLLKITQNIVNSQEDYTSFFDRMTAALVAGLTTDLDKLKKLAEFEGREVFLKELGKGVSGSTYLVYSPDFKANMALKVCSPSEYSKAEAAILRELKHPNIVSIRYARDDIIKRGSQKVYAIMMEYVDGNTLAEVLQRNPYGIGYKRTLSYSHQLLEGLIYLKRKGYTHRDIHPGNIMVDNRGRVIIVDFGIATEEETSKPKNNRRYGGKTDLFSWGLLTYKMITGEHFLNEGDGTTMHADTISEIKKDIWLPDGKLKEEYSEKIKAKVPEQLHRSLELALEHVDRHSEPETYLRLKIVYNMISIDKRKKELVEEAVGHKITMEQYLDIYAMLVLRDEFAPKDPRNQ